VDELLPASLQCKDGGAFAPPLAFFLAKVGSYARRQSLGQKRLQFLPAADVGNETSAAYAHCVSESPRASPQLISPASPGSDR
jgi:hypothetical protein